MDKKEFKEFLKNLFAGSNKQPEGASEYQKQVNKVNIEASSRMFIYGIKKAILSMPVSKFREMSHKIYNEKELSEIRESFFTSVMPKYITNNNIDTQLLGDEYQAYKNSYYKADYDRYKDVIGGYVTKEEWDAEIKKKEKDAMKGTFYHSRLLENITTGLLSKKNVDRQTINDINAQMKTKMRPTVEECKQAVSTVVTPEQFENVHELQPECTFHATKIKSHADEIVDFVADNLTPEDYEKVKEEALKRDTKLYKPTNEIEVPKYPNEIKNMRQMELTKEQEEALNYIEQKVVDGDTDFNSELETFRFNVESAMNKDDNHIVNEVRQQNGTNDLTHYEAIEMDNGTKMITNNVMVMDHSNPEKVQEFKNEEMKFRPETQKSLVDILNKMDEYGIISDHAVGEQGGKIYGLHQLATLNGKIDEAMREGKKEELPALVEEHKKLMKQYNEIFDIINKEFPVSVDNMAYGGNIDVARNYIFPPEIRRQVATVSHFNGLYLVGSYLKSNNIKPEEFFKAPNKHIMDKIKQYTEATNPKAEDYKGKSPAHMIFDMQLNGIKFAPDTPAFIRLMENTFKFEKDPELRKNNTVVYDNYDKQQNAFSDYMSVRNTYNENEKLFQKILIAPEEKRGYNLAGGKFYDPVDMKITQSEPFDEISYIKDNEIDLKEFNERIENSIKDFHALDQEARKDPMYISNINTPNFVVIAHEAATKVLAMKPELKNTAEYQKLLKFVESPKTVANELLGKDYKYSEVTFIDTKDFGQKIDEYVADKMSNSKKFGKTSIDKDKELNSLLKKKNPQQLAQFEDRINTRKTELEKDFREGKITEHYYKARLEQLNNKDFKSELPAMFEYDKMPSKKDYMKQNGLDDLPKEDQDLVYEHYKDKAKREKEQFFRRDYLRKQGFDKEPIRTFEEMNPELKGADKIISPDIKVFEKKPEVEDEFILVDEMGREYAPQQIHVDLDEPKVENTNIIKDNGKNINLEKDAINK